MGLLTSKPDSQTCGCLGRECGPSVSLRTPETSNSQGIEVSEYKVHVLGRRARGTDNRLGGVLKRLKESPECMIRVEGILGEWSTAFSHSYSALTELFRQSRPCQKLFLQALGRLWILSGLSDFSMIA